MKRLISDNQNLLNQNLHKSDNNFGNRPTAGGLARKLDLAILKLHKDGCCDKFLDYGTGKGLLVDWLRKTLPKQIEINGYDPAVPEFASPHVPKSDIVTCLDVLEHVEPDKINSVLCELQSLTKYLCFCTIDLQPSVRELNDGRNAHILLAPPEWWITRFSQIFDCIVSFPIFHTSGHKQKIIILATNKSSHMPQAISFLEALDIYNGRAKGGYLKAPDQT